MLLFEDGLWPEEITVSTDLPLWVVRVLSQQVGLCLSEDSLTTFLGWLIVAQVDTLRLRQQSRGIMTLVPVSNIWVL